MLQAFRSKGASIVIKGLMGVLVLSFALWGLGDVFNPNSATQPVATAGDTEISQPEFLNALRNQQSQLRARGLSEDIISDENMSGIVISQLLSRAVYEEEARNLNLVATPETISKTIQATPEFQDSQGNFDRNRYEFTLSSQGMNPAFYENLISRDVVSNMLLDTISAGAHVAKTQAEILYQFQDETRDIAYVKMPVDPNLAVAEPDQKQLEDFYKENEEQFRAPDYRNIGYIWVDPIKLGQSIEIDQATLEENYNNRKDQFTTAEQRNVLQMLFDDQDTALKAKSEIEAGKKFSDVARELAGQSVDDITLGKMTQAEMPDEVLGNAAWGLELNQVSDPIEGLFGWYLLSVSEIDGEVVAKFDDVKDQLKAELANEQAISLSYDLSNQIDDLIAGGATLEEAAEQTGIEFINIPAIDATGRNETGNPIENLPNPASFLQFAFTTEEGLDSLMQDDGNDGFFILRVDGITKSRIKALSEVTEQAKTLWIANERRQATEKLAKELAAKANEGSKIGQLEPVGVETENNVARPNGRTAHINLPTALLNEVFSANKNETVIAYAGNAYYVAQIEEINVPEVSNGSTRISAISENTLAGMTNDLLDQFNEALREKHGVNINSGLINVLLNPEEYYGNSAAYNQHTGM